MAENLLDNEMLDSYRELGTPEEPDFLKKFLTTFIDAIPAHLERIDVAIKASNFEDLARASHAIKSSCLNIGAAAIVERCAKIEANGKAGELGDSAKLYGEVVELCGQLKAEIHALPEFRAGA
jgi:two-component system, sensor histidine kinase